MMKNKLFSTIKKTRDITVPICIKIMIEALTTCVFFLYDDYFEVGELQDDDLKV